MVDPLDGTKELLKRNGEFTVNIALIEDGKPVMGVVHVPALDLSYLRDRVAVCSSRWMMPRPCPSALRLRGLRKS